MGRRELEGTEKKGGVEVGGHIVRASNTREKIKITQAEPSGKDGQVE